MTTLFDGLKTSTLHVLQVIKSNAAKTERDNTCCYCCSLSYTEIEEQSGWRITTVKGGVDQLCALKIVGKNSCEIECPRNTSKQKGRKKNHYQLLIDC